MNDRRRGLSAGLRDALRREALAGSRGFNLDEYRSRNGIEEFQSTLRDEALPGGTYDPTEAKGVHSPILPGSERLEDTRTWGNTAPLKINVPFGGPQPVVQASGQLIHVSRHRPTTFSILTVLSLVSGWTGAPAISLLVTYTIGVGQAVQTFSRTLAVPVPADGLQLTQQDQFPMHALQANCTLMGTLPPGGYLATVSQFAAPIYT